VPLGTACTIRPAHLGIIFTSACPGFLTPRVALNTFRVEKVEFRVSARRWAVYS
jgi:hypothetical protein